MNEPANDPVHEESKPIKNWREISKTEGMVYSLIIALVWTITRWWIFTQHGYFLTIIFISVILFFIGFALGLFENIEPETTDKLVYCGKILKGNRPEWENGYVFVPSPFPFMHRLKFRPMWSLLKKHWKIKQRDDNNRTFKHDVKIDSGNQSQHKINTDATLLEAAVFQGSKISWYWFWSMDGDAPYAFQEFGLKMIIVAVLLDCFNLGTTGAVNVYDYIFSFQSSSSCDNTETDWSTDLVATSFELDKVGCLNFYPPNGKEVGVFFTATPAKINGDFLIRRQYNDDVCYFSSNNNCSNFIESHLNEILIFKGSHFYLSN